MAAFRNTYKVQKFLNTYSKTSILKTHLTTVWKYYTQKNRGLESVTIYYIFKETKNNNSPNKKTPNI
jgi:hypothetical protein